MDKHEPVAAHQALEALDELESCALGDEPFNHFAAPLIRQFIEQALVKPGQEPVAKVDYNERGNIAWFFGPQIPNGTLLYSTPPKREWVGLTDEEAKKAFEEHNCVISADLAGILARAIQYKLEDKNT